MASMPGSRSPACPVTLRSSPLSLLGVSILAALILQTAVQAQTVISTESILPDDPTTHYSRVVNFAPGDGEAVDLNPPRFRWFYHPDPSPETNSQRYTFRFQIARDAAFDDLIVDVDTPYNFYNTIPELTGSDAYYWRVHYKPIDPAHTAGISEVRSFRIAPNAQVWDRSWMADPDFSNVSHPRMLFTEQSLPRLRELVRTHPESKAILERMKRYVEEDVFTAAWWNRLPESDRDWKFETYPYRAGHALAIVAFLYVVTEDEKYADVVPQAVTMARYEIGGPASPEGAMGEFTYYANEDATQLTEFLALLYDWLYPMLSEDERAAFVTSLEWRIDHFVNNFSWHRKRDDGSLRMTGGSLAVVGSSHAFEGFFDTFPACLAIYEDSEIARYGFHLGVNYMVGVGSAHGFSEGWNEGPGYGNSKWAWQINAMSYLDSIFPEYDVAANPWVHRTGAFMRLQTPVGLKHAPWGHGSNRQSYYRSGHLRGHRKLAHLTGDGRFLADWKAWGGHFDRLLARSWIECALPLWRETPDPTHDEPSVRVFPRSGWVMAMSGPPSDPATYENGLGIVFCARPRGAYSHSFGSDNSFHLFGYGQDLSHAAGDGGYEPHAYHSMSHNTILVDGLGQFQGRGAPDVPYAARLTAFHQGENFVYWCGDATLAYPRKPGQVRHWWGELDNLYTERYAGHLSRFNRHVLFVRDRYFVILDDLAASKPTQFSWLYHARPRDPESPGQADPDFNLDPATGSFTYSVEDVRVHVTHLLGRDAVDVLNQRDGDSLINPLTGEDYTNEHGRARPPRKLVAEHNVYVTNRDPATSWRFMSTIVPVPPDSADAQPIVERVDDLTVRVTFLGEADVISFDSNNADADIVVDLPAIATSH